MPQLRAPTTTSASHTGSRRLMNSIASSLRCDGLCETTQSTLAGLAGYTAICTFSCTRPVRPGLGGDEPPVELGLRGVDADRHAEAGAQLDALRAVVDVVDRALHDPAAYRAGNQRLQVAAAPEQCLGGGEIPRVAEVESRDGLHHLVRPRAPLHRAEGDL